MGKIYCCVTGCSNYSGKLIDNRKVSLHRFPVDSKISRAWEQRVKCFRKNFTLKNTTRLCSEHFVGIGGPSAEYPIPSVFPQKTFKTSKISDSLCTPHIILKGEDDNSSGENEDGVLQSSLHANISFLETSVFMHDYAGVISENHVCSQTNKSEQTDDVVILSREEFEELCCLPHPSEEETKQNTVDVGIQCKLPDITIEDIKNNDDDVMFYTGLPSFPALIMILSRLKTRANNMSYWRGNHSAGEKRYQRSGKQKPGPKRKLRIEDEFLLVMMRLRLGLLLEDLARRFCISVTTCCNIWRTWVQFLAQDLVPLLMFWPSKEAVQSNMPATFRRRYPNTRVILDCTEIRTETPESTRAKSLLYSNYKSHMTWKVLVGITPAGVPSLVTSCYAGSISDKKITEKSGVVDMCDDGDAIMVDKGFLISDMTTPKNIQLIIPPFKRKHRKFSRREVETTRRIANLRIHVERQMQRIKLFRILNGVMPISSADTASNVFKICTALTILYPPLIRG
ncbi:uncharacterized protein LOC117331295 [Pecten maximus]|uniref:uncharacterized protein LOC117331295 n=1 Tax=Pecten maximus TaxID=6579 RepID=UPI0014586C15|nr:uncharacterized protein LOC117331295 [Pecten maximus]